MKRRGAAADEYALGSEAVESNGVKEVARRDRGQKREAGFVQIG